MERRHPLLFLAVIAAYGCEARRGVGTIAGQGDELGLAAMVSGCSMIPRQLVALSGPQVDLPIVGLHWGERFLIVGLSTPHRVSVFDGDGSFVRHIGREGRGPGEFNIISAFLPFADSLLVMDARNMRATVFDERLEYVRDFSLPVQASRARPSLSPDDGFFVGGQMTDRRHFGSPVVQLSWDGEPLQYFEDAVETEGNLAGSVLPRALDVISDTQLVTLPRIRYTLELWSMEGTRSFTIEREVAWFSWPPDVDDPHRVSEPENALVDVQADEAGRLWTLALIDGLDWTRGVEDGRVVDHAAWVDAAIDIMHVGSGESICTYRLSDRRVPGGFVGRQTVLTYEEDGGGNPTVRFWRLEVDIP